MKQFKQLAALFLAFALVIGLFSQPTVVYAEETLVDTDLATDKVSVNYENERLEVTKTKGETVYYTVKWAEKSHAKTYWDEAYNESDTKALIDFSNVSAAKEVIFFLTTDKDKKPIEIKIAAQETALIVDFSGVANTTVKSKVKVENDWTDLNAETAGYKSFKPNSSNPWTYGFLNVAVGKGKDVKALTADEAKTYLQFRKGTTGQWQSITALDVRKYVAYGAQITFRIKPVNNPSVSTGSALVNLGRASKEVKVTYKKQANAPKVTINGVTKEIKLTKTHEYRVFNVSGSSITYGDWIKVADNHMDGKKVDKIYLKSLVSASGSAWNYNENNKGQGMQVRNAASDKGVASKIATIKLNQATTPSVTTGGSLEFKLAKSTTYDKGIIAKNTNGATGSAIQVAVVSGSSFDVNNTKEVKWITIAPGKYTTIAGTALKTGDTIIYRNATIKDNAKTSANEFVVSSDYDTYAYKSKLPLEEQTFTIDKAEATATVTGASPSAILKDGGNTIEVTSVTPSAITVALEATTKNIPDGAFKVVCVDAVTDSAKVITATKIKLVPVGGVKSDNAKLKLTVAEDATTGIFRITADGKNYYVTVTLKK